MIKSFCCFVFLLCIFSCQLREFAGNVSGIKAESFEESIPCVGAHLNTYGNGTHVIKFSFILEDGTHITATPLGACTTTKSLIAFGKEEKCAWLSTAMDNAILLRSATSLITSLSLLNSRVNLSESIKKSVFKVTKEVDALCRSMGIETEKPSPVSQLFDSAIEKVFYRLVQPQTSLVDYKRMSENLTQLSSIATSRFTFLSKNCSI